MKRFLLLSFIIFQILSVHGQNRSISWLTFESAKDYFDKNQKPILIYIYDNNCDSCKIMNDSTFALKEVYDYINILFYPIKFNAESKDSIKFFNGTIFKNTGNFGKYHDFVANFLGTNPVLPAIICFNREGQGSVFTGFKNRNTIFPILIYHAEDVHKSNEYAEFEKYYFKTYPPNKTQIITRVLVNWVTFKENTAELKKVPKKTFVFFYANWRVSNTMMTLTTMNNPKIAKYLNEKYYTINFDVQTKDTIEVIGKKYINDNKLNGFHQLAVDMLLGKMIFPSFMILDENYKLLERIQLYLTPEQLEPILYYYGEDAYKTTKWEDFKSKFKSKLNDK